MTRTIVRVTVALVAALAVFRGCGWLMEYGGTDPDTAALAATLATMPWAWALGTWAAIPPRVEPTYFASMSTREPAMTEAREDWR
jgi:hypothetical protein